MTLTRILGIAALSATVALLLTSCSLLGDIIGPNGSPTVVGEAGSGSDAELTEALSGTTWEGTDSVGDYTAFEFQADGSVGVTYNDQAYDDAGDVWAVSNGTLTVDVYIDADTGVATYVGPVAMGATRIDLSSITSVSGETWTLSLTQP